VISIHHNQMTGPVQGVYSNEEEFQGVLSRLPADWEEQAIKQGAWERVRKLARIEDLLRGLLVYAVCGYSFQQLGLWATLLGLGSLSERAWRKRAKQAQQWITWLLGALLGSQSTPWWVAGRVGRLLLHDGSRVKIPAGCGDDVRMHCTYDLQSGTLVQVKVTDRHSAEGVHHIDLRPGDVAVTDAGYPLAASVKYEREHGAMGLHRVAPHLVRLERKDGSKIDLKRLVKHQKYGTVSQYTVWIWDTAHEERFEVRLVISLLPRAQAMQARARKRERLRRKKGAKASAASAWWAGVMILATTLPQESWSAQDVVKLYRMRWQIELLFKRVKRGLQLYLIPVKVWERAQAYVHLCLLAWALQEQHAQTLSEELRERMKEQEETWSEEAAEQESEPAGLVLSLWKLAQIALETLRTQLRGTWTSQRLRDCLPDLQRYLLSRRRKGRPSQQDEVHQWLLQMLGEPKKESDAA
jgi:Transposase DDE domain